MKETVKSWKFGLTTVQWRKDDLQDRLRKSREIVAGVLEPDREPSGEEGILLMKALTGMDRVISNVNLPNAGQIPNLPMGAVVETNAVFAKDSVRPVMAGALPEEIRKLVADQYGKDISFSVKSRGGEMIEDTTYVTDDDLSVIHMDISEEED